MIARLLLLFSVVGLAGCAGTGPQDEPHEPKANAAWRKSLGDAAFVTLTPGETRQFQITPEFQTFGFPEGISYFVGVALPRSDKPRTLTLRTLPADPLRPRETHVFIPRVAIVALDGSVSRYLELEFQPSTQWIVPRLLARNTGWQGSLTLSPGESRLAVYTATLLRQTLRLHESEEAVEYWYVPSGPTGVIEITLNGD
jgi:hypothetical protein